jgi:hypothetical protein
MQIRRDAVSMRQTEQVRDLICVDEVAQIDLPPHMSKSTHVDIRLDGIDRDFVNRATRREALSRGVPARPSCQRYR